MLLLQTASSKTNLNPNSNQNTTLLQRLMNDFKDGIIMEFNMQERTFIANLITVGRKTGKLHKIPLRLVFHNNKFYASRRTMGGDWLNNLLRNPSVVIEVNGKEIRGNAAIVEDETLRKTISSLKYSDDRASMERIIIEITPKE